MTRATKTTPGGRIAKGPARRPKSHKPKAKPAPASGAPVAKERIAKRMARAGVASRRGSEAMIADGRVTLNGRVLDTPAVTVGPKDRILVDGQPLAERAPPRLWRHHKPTGLVTSHSDEKGRDTVFDALPKSLGRVISVGRLDINSEGLLLLTNDGELARALELPATGWSRQYKARAFGETDQARLDGLRAGIVIDGQKTGPIEATLDRVQGGNVWVSVTIREGKNREVRRALEDVGLKVNRLIRTAYGPFQLGNLARGATEAVKPRILFDQVGHLVDIPEPKAPKTVRNKRGRTPQRRR